MQIFKKKQHVIISYLVITLGILIYTFGWAAVTLPAKIVGGGVSGISSVLYYALGIHTPIGAMNLVTNPVLVLIGFKVLGSKFGANTISVWRLYVRHHRRCPVRRRYRHDLCHGR